MMLVRHEHARLRWAQRYSVIIAWWLATWLVCLPAVARSAGPAPTAVYGGDEIALTDAPLHHCHDGAFPEIRCFDTTTERDVDAAGVVVAEELGPTGDVQALALTYYVTFYEDVSYGGYSFTVAQPYPDLRTIGWNDVISSFKSLNGQRPRWYEDVDYGLPSWQWVAGAHVSNVGTANDRISAVKNVP